jgi:hypothetical protein
MNLHLSQHGCKLVPYSLIIAFMMLAVVSCTSPNAAAPAASVATSTSTQATPSVLPAATITELAFRARVLGMPPSVIAHDERNPTIQAWDDITVKNYADMLNQSALTPPPTLDRNPPPTDTPAPERTLVPGYEQCPPLPNMQHDVPYTCGVWEINGRMVEAKSGRHGRVGGDIKQGYLQVGCTSPGNAMHDTPARVGPVEIASVEGTRFYLSTVDPNAKPNTFIFDIATCQWVSP